MELSEELSIREFFSLLRRRRREFLVCWSTVFGATALYTVLETPIYRGEGTLRVQVQDDSARNSQLGALGLATPSATFNIEQLLTPQILEECIKRINEGKPPLAREKMDTRIQDLEKRTQVEFQNGDHTLVSVSVTSPHAQEATNETNVLSKVMVDIVGEDMTAKTHRTKQFIEDELKETSGKLKESEERLRQSREKMDPQSAGGALGNRLAELKNRRSTLLQKYTTELPEIKQLTSEIRELESQVREIPNQEIDVTRVMRDVRLNEEMFTMLTKRLEELQIMESAHVAPISIVEPAAVPSFPESPNKRYNLTMGALAGLLVGLIVVMARHHFDTSMVTPEEIETYLQLPVLAAIPHIERRNVDLSVNDPVVRKADPMGEARSRLILNFQSQSPHAEVHHLLRNNLMKDVKTGDSRIYLFTSAIAAEGKSITAANFAIAAAQSGIPTLLAEVDLREPMVDKLFGLPSEPGITNYFYTSPRWETSIARWEQIRNGASNLKEAINLDGISNLHILPSGKRPSNPISLLSSDRFPLLLRSMRQRFPLIILDGAPALLFADSSIMGPHVDGIILVYRFGRTAREILRRTHNQLATSNAKILGIVVNDIMQGQVGSYNSYYGSYYKGGYGQGSKYKTPTPSVRYAKP
jgi:capsular exopolysaccharide synthesis family protein